MKNLKHFTFALITLLIFACSGSDTFQGDWKATDSSGEHFEINFEPKQFTVLDAHGQLKTFEYTQNSISINNSAKTYGIKLDDGRHYSIYFPSSDTSVGTIEDDNENVIYTIGRTDYISFEELFEF